MKSIWLSCCVVFVLLGCQTPPQSTADSGLRASSSSSSIAVGVSTYPLAWTTNALAQEWCTISFPMQDAGDPAYWQPRRSDIQAWQNVDLIFLNGADYETWLPQVSLPRHRLVDTSLAVTTQLLPAPVLSHDHGHHHAHGRYDFTWWLDLSLFQNQVAAVTEHLQRVLPQHADKIGERSKELQQQIELRDKRLRDIGQKLAFTNFLTSHPVYGYLRSRYGLSLYDLEWEPDAMPSLIDWEEGIELARLYDIRHILFEDTPLPEMTEKLSQAGIEVVVWRTCSTPPPSGDFLQELDMSIDRLERIISKVP